jgi:uncharacterized alkaline shock family protein YloU
MSESEGQRNHSPLLSERGVTTISDTVVSQLAGMAAQEVEGVHMGGGASRTAGGVLESLTGSESKTSGISVEVGRTETAIDLKMGIEYNRNILQTVEEVRQRITARVQEMTGLRIKELNATITDITFPEKEARRRLGPATRPASDREDSPQTAATPETQATPESETSEPDEPETTQPETTQAETTQVETASGAPAEDSTEPEEEATVGERPPEESATTEVRTEDQPADEASEAETQAESETPEESRTRPEPETPEARMRRRAEERTRRRRRRSEDS